MDSTSVNKKKLNAFIVSASVGYSATLVGLNSLWYKNSEKQSFQFFNDNPEWMQIDKLGHLYSAFYLSYSTSKALRWCNVNSTKADLMGALTGFAVLVPIEIFDGFSNAYGASTGDLLANAAGASFFLVQQKLWKSPRLYPKFSFHRTNYARLRPTTLGNDLWSEMIKDYNGQTYWLSIDADKFIGFPRWLNLAIGYGGENMIYARKWQNIQEGFGTPFRQYYISLDLDLTSIRSKSKVINTLIFVVNMIKLPAPSLAFSAKGLKFHPLYF